MASFTNQQLREMYKKSAILLIPENVEVPNELCSIDERSASLGGNGRRRFVLYFVRLAVLSQFRSGFPDSTFAMGACED